MNKKMALKLMNNFSPYMVHLPVRRAIIMVLSTVLMLLISLLLWVPAYLDKERYANDTQNLRHEISTLKAKTEIAKTLQRNRSALTEVTKRLSQSVSQATLIKELNSVVSTSGVIMTEQSFREVSEYDEMSVYRQSLIIRGSYGKIRYFMSLLSTAMPGLNVIGRVDINKEDGTEVSAHLDLDTYSVRLK